MNDPGEIEAVRRKVRGFGFGGRSAVELGNVLTRDR
jgi:hypothetical protein